MARDVEGFYSKRPIQCVASSERLKIPKLESVNYILYRVHMFMFSISKNRMYKNPGMSASLYAANRFLKSSLPYIYSTANTFLQSNPVASSRYVL
jgi:hypothetical protein